MSKTEWIPPWEPNYPKGGNPLEPGQHNPFRHRPAPESPAPKKPADKPVESPAPAPVAKGSLEDYVLSTAQVAARNALPELSKVLKGVLITELTKEMAHVGPGIPPALEDLTKKRARGAALRSLAIGLFIAVLTGIGSALAAVPTGTNWFTKEGLIVTGTLVINSVIQSLLTYAHQLGWGPPQTVKVRSGDGECSS